MGKHPDGDVSPFRAAWFCPSPHLQSIWGYLFRSGPSFSWRRERWETPDGDFLDLDFLDAPRPEAPTLFALHELEGSSDSHYVRGVAALAAGRGWRAVALNFRSCSGEPNRSPRLYHSGETQDLDFAVRRLGERFQGPLLMAGFSLGGNVLLKWLGECGERPPGSVRGAVAVSASFHPGECAKSLDSLRGAIYRWHLLPLVRKKSLELGKRYPGLLDPVRVGRSRTFQEFDRWFTSIAHGFEDEVDYYRRASSIPYIPHIRVPALLLNAADDPIVPPHTFPHAAVADSPWLSGMMLPRGGHVGFVTGSSPFSARYWAEERVVAFLSLCLGADREPVAVEG